MGLEELQVAWNAQADEYNQWDELGLDEIVAFAQEQALIGAATEIERLRGVVNELAALAQHTDGCSWITPLPTGEGYWGCDCGLDRLVLDGEPTETALTPNNQGESGAAK